MPHEQVQTLVDRTIHSHQREAEQERPCASQRPADPARQRGTASHGPEQHQQRKSSEYRDSEYARQPLTNEVSDRHDLVNRFMQEQKGRGEGQNQEETHLHPAGPASGDGTAQRECGADDARHRKTSYAKEVPRIPELLCEIRPATIANYQEQHAGFDHYPDCQPDAHRPQSPNRTQFGDQVLDQRVMAGLVVDAGAFTVSLTDHFPQCLIGSMRSHSQRPDAHACALGGLLDRQTFQFQHRKCLTLLLG